MQTSYVACLCLFSLTLQVSCSAAEMDSKALLSAINKFSAKFCNELEKDKNVVSSPLSAEFVLGLLTLGTSDPAHSELLTSLFIPDDNAIRSAFSSVSSKLKAIKGVTLNVANKVYVKEGSYELKPELKEDAVTVFDADFEKIDFKNGAVAAASINKWVESKTNDKIKDLLSPDSLDESTRLVLVNALYFKGSWKKKFDASRTRPKPFHVNSATTVDVPMMFQEDNFKYGESPELNVQLLEMAYEGEQSSLLIVLPKEIEGLNSVLAKLADGYDLQQDLDRMFSNKVNVAIPKFKIETEIDLTLVLQKLGIKSIFNMHNTGIDKVLTNNEELSVTKAVQKAFIEVNEEGAEAAAATAMGIALCSAMVDFSPVQTFTADRPFLAAILIDKTPYFLATLRSAN